MWTAACGGDETPEADTGSDIGDDVGADVPADTTDTTVDPETDSSDVLLDEGVDTAADAPICDPVATAMEALATVDLVSESNVTAVTDGPITTLTIDASAGGTADAANNPYVYVDLSTGEQVYISDVDSFTDTSWTIGLRRAAFRLNSADSGPSTWMVSRVDATSWADMTVPANAEAAYLTDEFVDEQCVVATIAQADAATAFGVWYDYNPDTHAIAPTEGVIYSLYNAATHAVLKLEILSWEDGVYELRYSGDFEAQPTQCDPAAAAAELFGFNESANLGDVSVESTDNTYTATVDASSGGMAEAANTSFIYLNLPTGEQVVESDVDAIDEAWTIAIKQTDIRINSGDSGPGQWLAITVDESFETATAPAPDAAWLSDDVIDHETCEPLTDERGSALTALYGWYDYDPDTHVVSAPDDVTHFLYDMATHTVIRLAIESYNEGTYSLRWSTE